MATCEHQHAVCSDMDALALRCALSELHVLRRQWSRALESGVGMPDTLSNTSQLARGTLVSNSLRLSAAAEAALVRNFLMLVTQALHFLLQG